MTLALPAIPTKGKHPKVHQADLPDTLPVPDAKKFTYLLDVAASERELGDPLAGTIQRVGGKIFYIVTKHNGLSRAAIDEICALARCCHETFRRVCDYLERKGIMRILNRMVPPPDGGRERRRGPNLYLILTPLAEGLKISRRVAAAASEFWEYCGRLLGLEYRPELGFNTTPLRRLVPQSGDG
jgi:hypothetical protein